MAAQKQKAMRMMDEQSYHDDINLATDMLNVALEDVIYELLALGTNKQEVEDLINKKFQNAVIRLFEGG